MRIVLCSRINRVGSRERRGNDAGIQTACQYPRRMSARNRDPGWGAFHGRSSTRPRNSAAPRERLPQWNLVLNGVRAENREHQITCWSISAQWLPHTLPEIRGAELDGAAEPPCTINKSSARTLLFQGYPLCSCAVSRRVSERTNL